MLTTLNSNLIFCVLGIHCYIIVFLYIRPVKFALQKTRKLTKSVSTSKLGLFFWNGQGDGGHESSTLSLSWPYHDLLVTYLTISSKHRNVKTRQNAEKKKMTMTGAIEWRPKAKVSKVSKSCLLCFILSKHKIILLFRPKWWKQPILINGFKVIGIGIFDCQHHHQTQVDALLVLLLHWIL